MGGPTGYLVSSQDGKEPAARSWVSPTLLSFSTVKHRTDSRMGFPQPLRVFAAPHCAGPCASLLRPQPPSLYPLSAASIASHFSTSLCAAGDVPRAPTDPPKFTSALGARLPGGLRKGIPEFLRGAGVNGAPGGRAGGGRGGVFVAPRPGSCEVRGPGRAGAFQPGRRSAAAAAADVEERSAEAGARRPLLFI